MRFQAIMLGRNKKNWYTMENRRQMREIICEQKYRENIWEWLLHTSIKSTKYIPCHLYGHHDRLVHRVHLLHWLYQLQSVCRGIKIQKTDGNFVTNYRPISLLCMILSKVLERCVFNRLIDYLSLLIIFTRLARLLIKPPKQTLSIWICPKHSTLYHTLASFSNYTQLVLKDVCSPGSQTT
jgi:hypothetical protein